MLLLVAGTAGLTCTAAITAQQLVHSVYKRIQETHTALNETRLFSFDTYIGGIHTYTHTHTNAHLHSHEFTHTFTPPPVAFNVQTHTYTNTTTFGDISSVSVSLCGW